MIGGNKVCAWWENLRLDDIVRWHLGKESLGAFPFAVIVSPDLIRKKLLILHKFFSELQSLPCQWVGRTAMGHKTLWRVGFSLGKELHLVSCCQHSEGPINILNLQVRAMVLYQILQIFVTKVTSLCFCCSHPGSLSRYCYSDWGNIRSSFWSSVISVQEKQSQEACRFVVNLSSAANKQQTKPSVLSIIRLPCVDSLRKIWCILIFYWVSISVYGVYVCPCICRHVWRPGWCPGPSSTLHLIFLKQGLSLNLKLHGQWGEISWAPRGEPPRDDRDVPPYSALTWR